MRAWSGGGIAGYRGTGHGLEPCLKLEDLSVVVFEVVLQGLKNLTEDRVLDGGEAGGWLRKGS